VAWGTIAGTLVGEALFSTPPQLLYADSTPAIAPYLGLLRQHYHVATADSVSEALASLTVRAPDVVVMDLHLGGEPGLDVCRRAKQLPVPASVLLIPQNVDDVPDGLTAGCDAVLLKPFPPNLLHSRLARLMRIRMRAIGLRRQSALLVDRAHHQRFKAAHLLERTDLLDLGLVKTWPTTQCPYCNHEGVTAFDSAGLHKAWYACLACRKVWMARRPD
jgi:DNA-binding response OmpR family regulator